MPLTTAKKYWKKFSWIKLQEPFLIVWITLHKKWSYRLWISSVNVNKPAGNCGFGHIYWRNPWWKTSFFVWITICSQTCSCSRIPRKIYFKIWSLNYHGSTNLQSIVLHLALLTEDYLVLLFVRLVTNWSRVWLQKR